MCRKKERWIGKTESAFQCLVCEIVACERSSQEPGRKRNGDLQTEEAEEKMKEKSKTPPAQKRAEDEENEGPGEGGGGAYFRDHLLTDMGYPSRFP